MSIEAQVAYLRTDNCPIDDPVRIRLSNVLAAMSRALDITEGQPEGHAARTCLIGMRLAQELSLEPSDRAALFYALLLKDLGCSSNAAKMSYLFGADDHVIKRDLKTIDWPKMSASMKFLLSSVAPGAAPFQRLLKMAAMAIQGPTGAKKLVETRCERGAKITRDLGFPEKTAQAILDLDEHWNGQGHPHGLRKEQISLLGRIACLAQTVEVFVSKYGWPQALEMAQSRRGRWFDPALVDALKGLRNDIEFQTRLAAPDAYRQLAEWEPPDLVRSADPETLDRIAEAFAHVVDAKSPWTYRHSTRVAEIAVSLAEALGFDNESRLRIRRMGLLHDIGKLGVSNMILDKPGKLTEEEFGALRLHPQFTHSIVSQVEGYSDFAVLAAAHHERIDQRGYHIGLNAAELPIAARLLTVSDVFEALTAARPYRDGMPVEKVMGIIQKDVGVAFCPIACSALQATIENRSVETRVEDQLKAVERLMSELSV